MSTKKFRAQMEDIANLTEKQLIAVFVDSIQDVMEAVQTPQVSARRANGPFQIGKIPVDEGDLIQSLEVGLNGAYTIKADENGGVDYSLAMTDISIGGTFNARWTAAYAMRIELGFSGDDSKGRTYNQAGRHFVGKNAARWPEFVKANAAKYRV